jgi:uncharacterized protein YwqG
MPNSFILPNALESFRPKFAETIQSFIRVNAQKSTNTTLWQSKVGGIPYMPAGHQIPCAPDGQELHFLAQINFEEMPSMPPFPNKGILQFFIQDDDLLGMDFEDGEVQDTFRVIYHPEITKEEKKLSTKFNMLREYEFLPHHPEESYPLIFSKSEEIVPVTDFRFYEHFGQDFFQQFGAKEWDIMDEYAKENKAEGHKIGGYAYFTQDDPRKSDDPMLLLLQLDSDEVMDLMWGDMGVGHFFIREKDLLALDFSKVLYDWDNL